MNPTQGLNQQSSFKHRRKNNRTNKLITLEQPAISFKKIQNFQNPVVTIQA